MKTRLLIRPNSDVKILDTVFADGYVGLLVEDLKFIDIKEGDLVSLEFNDTSLNPNYNGSHYVTSVTDYPDVITLRVRWGNNGPKNPGFIRNWVRIQESVGQIDTSFQLDRVYNFDINQLEVDRKGRYIHGGLYDSGTYSNIIGGRVLQTGQLDLSFQVGSGFNEFPRAILMYDDGSMIIGGRFTEYNGQTFNRIVKLNEDGSVNDVFNSGTGFDNYVYGLAKHKKGIIVVGSFTNYNGTPTNGIIKLKQDGTIDNTFNFGTGLQGTDRAYSVLTTSDNKVVVGGHFTGYRDNASNKLVRINADGSWDSSFVVGSGPNGNVLEIKEDLDRSIIFCGNFSGYDGDSFIGICKVDQNGTADNDWSLPFNGGASTTSVDIQSNGKYIISGSFTSFDGNSVGRIVRLNSDLTLDTTFDTGTGFNAIVNSKLLPNGQIVCYGQFTTFDGVSTIRLTRLDAEGRSIRFSTEEFDLEDDIQFPLNYSVLDIRQPEKRKSDFSKTITLPGTKNNNKIFHQIFELGAEARFNPNLKKDVICLQDGFQIFTGFMKMDVIDRENWNDKQFSVKLSGQLSDIYSKLVNSDGEDLKISDLDFSEYDHFVNRGTVIESWIGNITKNYFDYSNYTLGPSYSVVDSGFVSGNFTAFVLGTTPDLEIGDVVRFEMDNPGSPTVSFDESQGMHTVIDVGTNSVTVNLDFQSGAANTGTLTKYQSMGEGYVYPTMNLGPASQNISQLSPQEFRISWYTKDIMDKIFDYIGFSYESSFFESEYFKRLVITGNPPTEYYFNGTNPNLIPLAQRISADNTINRIKIGWTVTDEDDIFYFWNSTDKYYENGNAELNVKFDVSINYIFTSGTLVPPNDSTRLRIVWVRSLNLDGSPNSDWEDSGEPLQGGNFNNLGNILDDQGNQMVYDVFNGAQIPSTWNSTTKTGTYNGSSPYLTLRSGEKVKVFLVASKATQFPSMYFHAGFSKINTNHIRANSTLPSMTAKDLLNSLVSMHNLYLEADKVNPRSLSIESFNQYYRLDQNSKDWTLKMDLSRTVELEPVSPNTPRNYIYKYADDGDYLNKLYKDNYQVTYGTFEISQDSEFNSDTITTAVKFPQTVLEDREFDSTRIIVPTIVKDVNYVKSDSFNTRILYFTGIRYTSRFQISGSGIGVTSSTSDYFGVPCFGYAGHMDNPFNATLDINFGLLDNYYFGGGYSTKATRNTLFEKYYKNYFEEITDPETKLLTAYFKLNSYDISTLSFRNLFYIKDNLWRLQKVIDYDPLSKDPTKCEFIKVKRTGPNTSFNPQSISSGNILDTFPVGRGNPLPISPTSINIGSFNETRGGDPNVTVGNNNNIDTIYTYTNGNDNRTTGPGGNIIINGDDNTVNGSTKVFVSGSSQSVGTGSTNVYSYGDDNRIGASTSNIYNFGNNNTFPDGLTNSYVFGNNVNATQSDSIYFGGNIIFSGTISGLTASIPHYDAIGYYEGGVEVDQFTNPTSPYFKVYGFTSSTNKYFVLGNNAALITASGSGDNNNRQLDSRNVAIFGVDNYSNQSENSIISGSRNTINTSTGNNVSGLRNTITNGGLNSVSGEQNTINSSFYNTISGILNQVSGGYNAVFGNQNSLLNGSSENIVSGFNNLLSGTSPNTPRWNIISGSTNQILNGSLQNTTSGFSNILDNVKYSQMHGERIRVTNATYSSVIASRGITFSNVNHTSVISMNNFIATQSNMVYMPNAYITGNLYLNGSTFSGGTGSSGPQNLQQVLDTGNQFGNDVYLSSYISSINIGSSTNIIDGYEVSNGIYAGQYNKMTNSIYGSIIGSLFSTLTQSSTSTVISSDFGEIDNSGRAVILGCGSSKIINSSNALILSSSGVTMSGVTNSAVICVNDIIATESNTVYLPNLNIMGNILINGSPLELSTQSSIIGGSNNYIYFGSTGSALVGGDGNYISQSEFSTILGGQNNYVELGSFDTIVGSLESYIYDSEYSNIVASVDSSIATSSNSAIFGSDSVRIGTSSNTGIISSQDSSIIGSTYSSIVSSNPSNVSNPIILESINSNIMASSGGSIRYSYTSTTFGGEKSQIRTSTASTLVNSTSGVIRESSTCTDISSVNSSIENSVKSTLISCGISSIEDTTAGLIINSGQSHISHTQSYTFRYSSIYGGQNCDILGDSTSNILNNLFGSNNTTIRNSNRIFASSLNNSTIGTSSNCFVSLSDSSEFYELDYSSIIGGLTNNYNRLFNSNTIGGVSNTFNTSNGSLMIGGVSNTMTYSTNSLIIGGSNNTLKSPGPSQSGTWGSSVIIGGIGNNLNSCGWSVIAGGDSNTMTGFYSGMVGGAGNALGGTYSIGNYCFQGGGSFNFIGGSVSHQVRESGMVGGIYNTINSRHSFMGGGLGNTLFNDAHQSVILGGQLNRINGSGNLIAASEGVTVSATNTSVLGCNGLVATQSNTTYTGLQIHVGNSPTILPESSLASATIIGNDMAGRIDFEIGGSPATGLLFTVTWNQNFPNSSGTVFSNGNTNTFLNALTWTTQGQKTLEMNVNNSLSAGTTFSVYYNNSPW